MAFCKNPSIGNRMFRAKKVPIFDEDFSLDGEGKVIVHNTLPNPHLGLNSAVVYDGWLVAYSPNSQSNPHFNDTDRSQVIAHSVTLNPHPNPSLQQHSPLKDTIPTLEARKITPQPIAKWKCTHSWQIPKVKCNRHYCQMCPALCTDNRVRNMLYKSAHFVYGDFTCTTKRTVYLIHCNSCGTRYISSTMLSLEQEMNRILEEITQRTPSTIAEHFTTFPHTHRHIRIQPLALVGITLPQEVALDRLKQLEEMWIKRLETKHPFGLNS